MREESVAESSQERMKRTELYFRSVDAQLEGFNRLLQKMSSAISPYAGEVPEHVAKYLVMEINDYLEHWRMNYGVKAFDPNQPRNPNNGQWISGNVDDSNDDSIDKFQSVDKFSTSGKGVEFIKQSEGFRSQQYLDASKRPTIGYGHLLRRDEGYPNGISQDEALKLLEQDVKKAENAIKRNVKVELSQHKFDALTSFIYNIGGSKFEESTMLKRLNEGKYKEAADEFPEWNKVTVNGIKVPSEGLSKRRARERKLFLRGKYE